jgi:hypothetical protein
MSESKKQKFLQTLASIAQGQEDQGIFPETGRLPEGILEQRDHPEGNEGENLDTANLINALRGGKPGKCDFCGQKKPNNELEPEEGGQWACWDCLTQWENQQKKPIKKAKEKK